jgi:protein-tyrosine-phosphatase/predicted ATP-grasp superfamily ATP-dependent carboligase
MSESMVTRGGHVLVLGSDTRSFLAVVRSLGRAGLKVHVAWCDPQSLAARSRYVFRHHDLPRFTPGEDVWLRAFRDLLVEWRFHLVVPCDDPSILPLAANREALEALAPIYLLNPEAFDVTLDKGHTHALAAKLGIPVPRTAHAATLEQAKDVAREFGFPVIAKPPSSFTLSDTTTKRAVRTIADASELAALQEWFAADGALLQEFVAGHGAGVEVLAREGRILVAFQHVRLHEPLRGGGSSYRASVPVDPTLLAHVSSLVRELNYTGVGMFEFRVNPITGRSVLLEINGRFWGSLPLAIAAGADFPRYLYEMVVEGRDRFESTGRTGLRARNWSEDFYWFAEQASDPQRRWLAFRTAVQEAGALATGKERSDTFVLDDPVPGLLELGALARKCAAAATKRARALLTRALTGDRPKRRLLNRVRESTKLLFLCKGNICRSAFAEHYARRVLPRSYIVRSAGHLPLSGRPCPEFAVSTAERRFAIDLRGHRSSSLTAAMVDEADLILAFDEQQLAAIEAAFPGARSKVHLLGALGTRGDATIQDPYGRPESEFVRTFTDIASLIDVLAAASKTGPLGAATPPLAADETGR